MTLRRTDSGMTLVEVAIFLTLAVFLLGTIYGVMATATDRAAYSVKAVELHAAGRRAVAVLTSELRGADASTVLVDRINGSDRVTFRKPAGVSASGSITWSAPVRYQVDQDASGEHRLVRVESGVTRFVCSHLAAENGLAVAVDDENVHIVVALEGGDGQGRTARASTGGAVRPRNRSVER